jgi:hypothetical protein
MCVACHAECKDGAARSENCRGDRPNLSRLYIWHSLEHTGLILSFGHFSVMGRRGFTTRVHDEGSRRGFTTRVHDGGHDAGSPGAGGWRTGGILDYGRRGGADVLAGAVVGTA